ncbi:MAG TPA: hydroxyacid dehydrogenase [Mycobacteriales bacterium]|jgi:phosphoglycerate dehydrogenase-like enzyme|nr:hydroxyacid dehydrogenase [Mycobacteriales bacterium]
MRQRAVVASGAARLEDVCSAACRDFLEDRFEMSWNAGGELTAAELTERLPGATVLLTSWGTPSLDERMLDAAPDLRAIGHAAGSVKKLVPESTFDRGIAVFSAGRRIADSVAEFCLASTLTMLRRLPAFDARLRAGQWKDGSLRGQELHGRHIGLIGASSTARAFLRLLAPFDLTVDVYDPYLTAEAAAALGVRKVSLREAMDHEIVSLHVPSTPETAGMIGRELLAALPDGALLINSARGAALDQDALFDELASGRISAALDVYDREPPKLDERIRGAANVLLTPHVAGDTEQGHLALLDFVVRDIVGWLDRQEKGPSFVDARAWNVAA